MVAHSKERVVEVERFRELRLPLGGKYGYIGVRGKQGPDKDKYQGYTKDKKHTTKLFNEPQEAAVALATLKQNISLGLCDTDGKKPRAKRNSMAARAGYTISGQDLSVCSSRRDFYRYLSISHA